MGMVKTLVSDNNKVWKDGEKKAKKIEKLIKRFSKRSFDRKMSCGMYSIRPVTEKDVKIFNKILSLYKDEIGIAEIHVDMSLYSLGFRRFSIDNDYISFAVAS